VLLDTPILNGTTSTLHYRVKKTTSITNSKKDNYKEIIETIDVPGVSFELEKDHWGNYKWFKIEGNTLKFIGNKNNIL
jgi:hypothetical protein